ncbi:MAG: 4Fe-4S cluster-binding domain-containing protein [Methanosarcinales archaeon]|nr:4Fe-4S cluster-binding domain-containing protein [Methanosarcinales archaeon]
MKSTTGWNADFTGSFHNYLSRGCQICRTGASMVLFVTGLCPRDCAYCPLSRDRKDQDIMLANEQPVRILQDMLEEAGAMDALGTGITGGEPLLKAPLVMECIALIKRERGYDHHIHLYTGSAPGQALLADLKEAGLDEIRFHPREQPDGKELYRLLKEARSLGLEAGVEMPALAFMPEVVEAVRRADAFLNLNELEFSETNQQALRARGFRAKEDSCGVLGSEEVARRYMIDGLKVHYCSSTFKDAVQLRERLKRRARIVGRPFDLATEDGTLIYGTIHSPDQAATLDALAALEVPPEMYFASGDEVEIAGWILEDIVEELRDLGCRMALVERYPMEGGLVVERIPL